MLIEGYINSYVHQGMDINLDPNDFLDCTDEQDLKACLEDVIIESANQPIYRRYIDTTIDYDRKSLSEFINEWKRLKESDSTN